VPCTDARDDDDARGSNVSSSEFKETLLNIAGPRVVLNLSWIAVGSTSYSAAFEVSWKSTLRLD
jgi:hypothetical protein